MSAAGRNLGYILGNRQDSDELAVIDVNVTGGSSRWRYRDIEAGAAGVAGTLQHGGFEPGTPIGLLGDNSVPYLLAYLGILRAGCVCVPINQKQPTDLIRYVCQDAGVRLVLHDDRHADHVPPGIRSQRLAAATAAEYPFDRVEAGDADTALVLYTSGSTGRPKGVVLSHESQLAMIDAITGGGQAEMFNGQRGIVVAPMFHMNALVFLAAFLSAGGSTVLMTKFNAQLYAEILENLGVTAVTGVPTMIALLYAVWEDIGKPRFESVNTVYVGSAPVTQAIVDQARDMMPNARFLNSYGTTETGGALFGAHPAGIATPPTSVGYPRPQVELRLEGGDREGTLQVRAPSMMKGYLNLPDLTAERLRDGWFNTGDRFSVDGDGFYYFVGRSDDMFVCSGENVYPAAVEQAIETHPNVVQAVVVAVANDIRGHIPVAFVIRDDQKLSERDVQTHVRANATPFLYPRHVWFLDSLPLASTAKVDRRALRDEAERRVARRPESILEE